MELRSTTETLQLLFSFLIFLLQIAPSPLSGRSNLTTLADHLSEKQAHFRSCWSSWRSWSPSWCLWSPTLVRHLGANMSKGTETRHRRANIAKDSPQDASATPSKHPTSGKKTNEIYMRFKFVAYLVHVPKSFQRDPRCALVLLSHCNTTQFSCGCVNCI